MDPDVEHSWGEAVLRALAIIVLVVASACVVSLVMYAMWINLGGWD